MSAEILREAAALMRMRAEAIEIPWHPYGDRELPKRSTPADYMGDMQNYLGGSWGDLAGSWHPAVALAVADWLRGVAADVDKRDNRKHVGGQHRAMSIPDERAGMTVATAYLGRADQ